MQIILVHNFVQQLLEVLADSVLTPYVFIISLLKNALIQPRVPTRTRPNNNYVLLIAHRKERANCPLCDHWKAKV